jgi:hypothetical protein
MQVAPVPYKRRYSFIHPRLPTHHPESIKWFIEDQAFSPSFDFAPPPTPFLPLPSVSSTGDTQEDWERETSWRERGAEGVGGRSQTMRRRESQVLYKSFNTLWPHLSPLYLHLTTRLALTPSPSSSPLSTISIRNSISLLNSISLSTPFL